MSPQQLFKSFSSLYPLLCKRFNIIISSHCPFNIHSSSKEDKIALCLQLLPSFSPGSFQAQSIFTISSLILKIPFIPQKLFLNNVDVPSLRHLIILQAIGKIQNASFLTILFTHLFFLPPHLSADLQLGFREGRGVLSPGPQGTVGSDVCR